MNCPVCRSALVEKRVLGIRLDRCSDCGGVWFDAGELEAYRVSVNAGLNSGSVPQAIFEPNLELGLEICPRCVSESLTVGTLGDHALRRCNRCAGVFVTSGTLAEFTPRSAASGAAEVASEGGAWAAVEAVEVIGWLIEGLS